MKPYYCSRELITLHTRFGLCTTEKQYLKEMKRLGVKQPLPWIKNPHSGATTHYLESDGELVTLVCIRVREENLIAVHGLLVHEATHIWQDYKENIGEKKPSKEFEAYAIQCIAQRLMEGYDTLTKENP